MVFSTNLFLFLFLPLFLLVYYLLPFKARSVWILAASYVFYAWWRIDFAALFLVTMLWSYGIGAVIAKTLETKPGRAKLALIIGIIGNLGTLGYFKYFNFGVNSLNAILTSLGGRALETWSVILPIGISFYVFQATSYFIDVYRRDAPPARNFWDLSAFIAIFPQLVAGPILRYKDVADQFYERTHTWEKFSEGSVRFMVGFCKKILIADTVAPLVTMTFAQPEPTMADAWLGALAYTLQLYFDFSAYSDMAVGLGLMMGFRFMENFNHPYISKNITEFWQRWHISLSTWLRDYLYIPLGGNRNGVGRTYINLILVMVLGGLWHGANWTFVIWGAWHGSLLALERFLGKPKRWKEIPAWLAIPRTLVLVMIGWVTFRAVDAGEAFQFYAGMAGLNGFALSEALVWRIKGLEIMMLVIGYLFVFIGPWWRSYLSQVSPARQLNLMNIHLLIMPLFILALTRLSAQNFSPFLYFQF
ncbi:MAG: MBOAT family O-acyltransferase [Trueperaceae bacterium]